MASFLSSGPSDALRRGAFGLVLALPLLAAPARAQTPEQDTQPPATEILVNDDVQVEEVATPEGVVEESLEVEQIQVTPAEQQELPLNASEQLREEPRVLITEVIIEGISGHPEQERVELAAYDAMVVRPGSRVTRDELKRDLDAIYATGWFSDVRIEPSDGPLGVQLVVQVQPNPLLTKVELDPPDVELSESVIEETFSPDYGRTLNLNELQARMKELQQWYANEGYSLARVTGPTR
ncbi:MAG: POTRA domain-containing protein, partial [Cyanobacteriota bacterium]|nr:POTRA domain-containing protein [Cyanobacteriota bacterium]